MSYRSVGMPVRSRKSLLIRGGAARTFGSIVAFLAALLLTVGAYVLIEVIAHPLAGGPAEIIGAAVLIALAAIMCETPPPQGEARHFGGHHLALAVNAGTTPAPVRGRAGNPRQRSRRTFL